MTFKFVQGIILGKCTPSQFTDGRQRSHIDAVCLAFAKFRVRMSLIVDIKHQGCVHDVLMNAVFWDAHIGCRTHHIAYRTVTVSTVFHQQLSRMQEKMHLRTDFGERLLEFFK